MTQFTLSSISGSSVSTDLPKPTGPYQIHVLPEEQLENPDAGLDADKSIGVQIISPIGAGRHLPILVFSHGFSEPPSEYLPLLEQVASHGYIVLNINNPSSSGPDPELPPAEEQALIDHLQVVQENNLKFIVQHIRNGSLEVKNGSPEKIVLGGHSMGGAASFAVAEDDPSIAGSIDLDGSLSEDILKNASKLKTPSLLVHENLQDALNKIPKDNPDYEKAKEYFAKITQDWLTFHQVSPQNTMDVIDGIAHLDFCASAILDPKTHEEGLKTYRVASQDMEKFMKSLFRDDPH